MKSTLSLRPIVAVLTIASTFFLIGCASVPKTETEAPLVAGTVRTYEVFGMDCPSCHGGLENLVKAVPGIVGAKASWQDKRLTLTVAEGADVPDEAVQEAISKANFTAGERLR